MPRLLSFAVLLATWWIASLFAGEAKLPPPPTVLTAMIEEARSGDLFFHLGVTLLRVALAFTLAMTLGAAIGYLMGRVRLADRLGDPWLILLLNLPALVVIVLAYIWAGLTEVAAIAAIAARPGVMRVFRSEDVRDAAKAKDPLLRAAALSYFPGRSGDLIIVTKPGWMISSAGTTHGSAHPDDQRVPLLFLGQGVTPGKYQQPATPADLAPTLAAIVGVSLKAEGHPLF